MHLYFLDVVDADVSRPVDLTFLAVIGVTILVEAIVLLLLRYNNFQRSLLHSFAVNAGSLAAGYLLLEILPGLFGVYNIPRLLLLMLITIAVELPLLYLLNRKKPQRRTIVAVSLMNLVTYFLFYLYIIITR